MNKKEIANKVAAKYKEIAQEALSSKEIEAVIDAFVETVKDNLASGEDTNLSGFGKFQRVRRKARKARNPITGEEVNVPERFAAKFQMSKNLKDAASG